MSEEIISFAVQKLWDLLSKEYDRFQGVKDQVIELRTDLNTLKSFLKDADAKKNTREVVKNCIEEIKEIVFDAEDTIETFILKDELGKNDGIKRYIRRVACIIPERREISLEIESLSKRISKVVCKMKEFGVQQIIADAKSPQPSQQRLEFARKYESNLVGMEENVEKLVGYLVEEDDVQVVSMTGMGGIGKTTLARQVFNHSMVKSKFGIVVWVCVTQVCDPINVWATILRTLRPNEEDNILKMTEDTLQSELFRLLETSNSFIVLDDIWKEEDWDQIKPIFPHTKGSKVLLTSRNERVAGRGETCILFKPDCLSVQDSWTLFQRIAMPSKDVAELNNDNKEMEEMGKQMIKHCMGLPLAVRVLGGLLAEKYTLHDWKRVSENIGPRLRDDNSFNRVLSLSFEELPSHLKFCFLYLAHFPEDYEIDVEKLAYKWAAEGIIGYNNDGETIRDVADRYIEELVRRNMVISERNKNTWRFETCCLHDLMREFCLSKAEEENFLQIVGIRSQTTNSRRFFTHHPTTLHAESEINNSKARSLVVVRKDRRSWNISGLSFERLQMLRVLLLPKVRFKGKKLPPSIGKLIHLRYLDLQSADVSFRLPASLRNLKLLIYLNLSIGVCSVTMGNNVLMGMKELRFLALPGSLHKKTKLVLSNLINLETLINFSTENCSLEDLRRMARLRSLVIQVRGKTSLETLSASIGGLRHLENLNVRFNWFTENKEWGTQLEFINLKQLKLSIHARMFSDGPLQFPSRVTCLFLEDCLIKEDPMPVLEKLPHLKEVSLESRSFYGKKMVCSAGGFPQLQKLELCQLDELEEWIVEEGSMPLLHTLKISWCEKLKDIPDGLRFLYSLKHMDLDDKWEESLSEGGEGYYKVKHIPSLKFYPYIYVKVVTNF